LFEHITNSLPPGCGDSSGTVFRLNRALYGCKQSSRVWTQHPTTALKSFGVDKSQADPCLLRFRDGDEVALLGVTHIKDMIAVGSRENCDALCDSLSTVFPTNNVGLLSWYTGCVLERDRE
ncbi:unnamed protein product, partial [Discosporangium mesarthrocarpum]